jgi:hypothetical protein
MEKWRERREGGKEGEWRKREEKGREGEGVKEDAEVFLLRN